MAYTIGALVAKLVFGAIGGCIPAFVGKLRNRNLVGSLFMLVCIATAFVSSTTMALGVGVLLGTVLLFYPSANWSAPAKTGGALAVVGVVIGGGVLLCKYALALRLTDLRR